MNKIGVLAHYLQCHGSRVKMYKIGIGAVIYDALQPKESHSSENSGQLADSELLAGLTESKSKLGTYVQNGD